MTQLLKVGLSAMIFNGDKVLMGKRKGSHGDGLYAFPGGAMEHGESIIDALKREIHEEVGIEIEDIQLLLVYNLIEFLPKHYVGLGFTAKLKSGEPILKEPNKCHGWGWYSIDQLPTPQFPTVEFYLRAYTNTQSIQIFDSNIK